MSRYCASCGKLLADDAKFCTSCGAPVEQTTASNGQPAFEQTGSLDTPQAKPDDPLAYRPDPAAGPAAVETTQRIPVADTPPQQQPAPTYASGSPQAPAAKKSATRALVAVIVVLLAIIIALVIFFVIKPFDNSATQTTAEVTKLHHDVDSDDLKSLGDPNSLFDDDDEDGSQATLSEQNLYRRLSEYYDLLEDLDNQVRACAEAFNGGYLEEDRTARQNLADVAERTEDTIEQYYDIVEDLDVPMSSKNYSSWKDIVALYDDLDNRIDAICDAWEISLKYAKPADHKDEIVAPLAGDNEPGTNSNKYRQDFEDRYPGAKPVEVK